jgi:hypothetical protein
MTIDLSSDSPTTSISVSEGASQTNFTVSFKFNNAADLNVFVDGTQKADNTISLVSGGSGSTGVIAISGGVTGATGGSTVVVTRDTVHSRTTDFPSAGAFSISKLNTELDALIFMNADKKFSVQRALTLSEFDDTSISTNIPVKADRLDKVLAFNSSTGVPEARDYLTAANATALASITAGTVTASKYVLVDANKDIGTFRNITLSGELDAGSLDISGDADIDGTLEADAITIGGVTLAETISDTVGAMVGSNTETGISVTYDDSDNTLDFVIGSGSIASSMIAADAITGAKIADDAINSEHYTDGSIDTAHIADDQVTQAKIADDAVGADQLASNAVVTASITDGNVTTDKIADDAVTLAKMAGLARGKIIVGDSSGNPTALALGSNGTFLKSDGNDLVFGAATISGLAADDLTAGDAAVNLTTTSGNITIDAQAGDSDIIFKGTDGSSDTTFLTLDGSDAGTAIFNHDVQLKSDDSVLSFGADNEITLTHNADVGLTLKNANTGDDKPVILALHTGETDLAANDVLGAIEFKAPDEGTGTDAIAKAAHIQAVSEGDFSATSNATRLEFGTGASESATTKMSLTSTGNLLIGTTTSSAGRFEIGGSSGTIGGVAGIAKFLTGASAGGAIEIGDDTATIQCGSDGTDAFISTATDIRFLCGASERMRVESTGHVGVGTTDPANSGLFGGTQVSFNVMGSTAPEVRIKSSVGDCDTSLVASNSSSNFFIVNGANGVALSHDGTSFGSASDENLKTIIEDIGSAETKINSLRAVIGRYKEVLYTKDILYDDDDVDIPDGKKIGDVKVAKGSVKQKADADTKRRSFLIAQDVQKVLPEAVTEVVGQDNETHLNMSYTDVIPLLVAGIKELSTKCADYEKRIKALESG